MLAKELPVYIDTKNLLSNIYDLIKDFPRLDRYTIGERLLTLSMDCLELILAANSDIEYRQTALTRFQIKFGTIETLIDLLNTKKVISIKQAAGLTMLIGKIGKQISGWKNKL